MELWKKLTFSFGGMCIITILLGFIGFSGIFKYVVKDQTALRKRNEIRKFYLELPIPLHFSVYFFNVTNPYEVQQGKTPILKEVGPYSYDLYKKKVDIVEVEAEDSLTYSPSDTYAFSQERSGNLSPDDYVTILHPMIVGMVNTVIRDTPAFLSIVNTAIKSIFRDPATMYLTARVRDILFDGFEINCDVSDFASKAVCSQLKTQIPDLVEVEKNVFLFSLLGNRNKTMPMRIKVLRGIKNSKDLGRVMEYNDQKELKIWGTKQCNRLRGTDGWIFPPFLPKEEGVWTFSTDLCRNVQAKFVEDTHYKGVPVRKYRANLGDQMSNPEDKCYCPTPKTCYKKGIMDLNKCMGVPILATLPHFVETDESYLKMVEGLHPNIENHTIVILFEYMTATPLVGKKRMQFNLYVQPTSKIDVMKNISESLHPLFWVEEGVELEGELFRKVANIFLLLKIVDLIKYLCLIISLGGMTYGGYLFFKNRNHAKITPVHKIKVTGRRKEEDKGYVNHAMNNSE